MIGLEELIVYILGVGLVLFIALTVETKKLYRMLIYFMLANLCLLGILGLFGLWIIGSLVVLVNIGVIVIFLFLTMIIGERLEEK
ncbi:MAG: hypothetical protein NDP24_05960 [Crenarchaeota archaeon]|nr:hypothetical protein [Thermoproteota archaeon]MCR8471184.1 hypothetical protein [Thermoproteota archaeon]MCR8472338.1 hypothetical protein [Thermoproteota archaeon]MCR8473670.1 hypothetical protein [Thermoproteota archaeon]MCR8489037.1 hypothetical protein [Thermoproteota archaeon]